MKVLDNGEDVLDDEQFDRKKSSIHSVLDKAYGTKNALTRDEIAELIADAGEGGKEESDDDDSVSSGAEEAALQQKSEIQSAGAGIFGFSKFLAASSSSRAPSAGTVATHKANSGSTTRSSKVTGTATTPKVNSISTKVLKGGAKKSHSSESSAVRHLDGRNERLHMNVKEDSEKIKKSLQALKEKLAGANDSDSQSKEFQALIKDVAATSRELSNDIKAATLRITRSKGDHDMSEQVKELKVLSV